MQPRATPESSAPRVHRAFSWDAEAEVLTAATECLSHAFTCNGRRFNPAPFTDFLPCYERAQRMTVPMTAFTPIAAWVLYQLGKACNPLHLVGAGTYCAFGWSFLVAGAMDYWRERNRRWCRPSVASKEMLKAVALDLDGQATRLATKNLSLLANSRTFKDCIQAVTADALEYLPHAGWQRPLGPHGIDLLFLDLDDSVRGKADYRAAFEAASQRFSPGACVVAHDGCCPRFTADIETLRQTIRSASGWGDSITLPIDNAGLLLAFREGHDGEVDRDSTTTFLEDQANEPIQ